MKVWRRTRSASGASQLNEVSPQEFLGSGKPSVLFNLSNAGGVDTDPKAVAGLARVGENLLGGLSDQVEQLNISYGFKGDEDPLRNRVVESNRDLDNFSNPEAEDFVQRYIEPAIAAGKTITFFSNSFGTSFADHIRAALIRNMRADGKEDSEISQTLKDIVLVAAGNASRSIDPDATRNSALDYTAVYASSPDDLKIKWLKTGSDKVIPEDHQEGGISLNRLSGNRVHITMNTPEDMYQWPDDLKKQGPEGTLLYPDAGNLPLKFRHDETRHNTPHYTMRNSDGTSPGGVALLERALRHAVTRESTPHVMDLISEYAPPLVEGRDQLPQRERDLEHVLIKEAIANMPFTDKVRNQKEKANMQKAASRAA